MHSTQLTPGGAALKGALPQRRPLAFGRENALKIPIGIPARSGPPPSRGGGVVSKVKGLEMVF